MGESSRGLRESLRRLWGIERSLLEDAGKPRAVFLPREFRVFELKPALLNEEEGWRLYLVRKEDTPTLAAASMLKRELRARRASFAGLKDSWGVSYQYISLLEPGDERCFVDLGRVKAWLLGEGGALRPGSHSGNIFKIVLETEEPGRVCGNLEALAAIPGFYGPQRFGLSRPSTHIYGLRLAGREGGWLLREYSYRYPLEDLARSLGYESRALREAAEEKSPWVSLKRAPRIAGEALQSYLFNRALSRALEERVVEIAETRVSLVACGVEARVPAARLPSRRLLKSGTRWAEIVRSVIEEEGVRVEELPPRAPLRPLLFPIAFKTCKAGVSRAEIAFCLPPSAYATIVLMEVADVELPLGGVEQIDRID
ncbi:MAG: tRNA pseudouridine(13) synthase TruD [Acidilobaceae archaeon]